MSRQYTKEEMRAMFLNQCKVIRDVWANEPRAETDAETAKDKIDGAIFSIMNIFDGTCGGFPVAIDLVLRPHKDDKKRNIEEGENWVKDGQIINDDCHLHEEYSRL